MGRAVPGRMHPRALIPLTCLALLGCGPRLERFAYVPNAGDGTVSVLDLDLLEVAATVRIGEQAAHGVAVTPGGRFVYAAEMGTGRVVRLDAEAQWRVDWTLETGRRAHGVDMSPDGRFLYVSASRSTGALPGDAVTVIDVTTGQTAAVVDLDSPAHLTPAPDSRRVYVTNLLTHQVSALRVPEHSVAMVAEVGGAFLPGGAGPNEVGVSPDGSQVWSADYDSDTVTVFDQDLSVVAVLNVAGKPHGIEFSPDGAEVWVAPAKRGEVLVFDAHTREQLATVEVGGEMTNHVGFTPNGHTALVSTQNQVVVVDVRRRAVRGQIAVGDGPHEFSLKQ
jgi:YVTN family beta-propeller protein